MIEHSAFSSVESSSERASTVTTEATHSAKATKTGTLFMFFMEFSPKKGSIKSCVKLTIKFHLCQPRSLSIHTKKYSL